MHVGITWDALEKLYFCGGHGQNIPERLLLSKRLPLLLGWQESWFASSKSVFSTNEGRVKMSSDYLHAQPPAPHPSVKIS